MLVAGTGIAEAILLVDERLQTAKDANESVQPAYIILRRTIMRPRQPSFAILPAQQPPQVIQT
jgi:hypothetical protein